MAKVEKFRSFYIMSYLSEKQIDKVLLEKDKQIRAVAYAYHDKDETINHHHILLYCYSPHTLTSIEKWFNRTEFVDEKGMYINTLVQNCLSIKGSFNYLTHEDEEDKYHYDISIIKGHDIDFFRNAVYIDYDCLSEAINDLLCGVTLYDCVQRYGRDFIIHYGHIKMLLDDINKQKGE